MEKDSIELSANMIMTYEKEINDAQNQIEELENLKRDIIKNNENINQKITDLNQKKSLTDLRMQDFEILNENYNEYCEAKDEKIKLEKKNEDIERFLAENHNTEELQRKKKHLELLCESQRKQSLYSYKTLVNAISDKAYMVFARSMLRASMELLKSAKMERRDIPYMRQATIDYIIKNKRCICCLLYTSPSPRDA